MAKGAAKERMKRSHPKVEVDALYCRERPVLGLLVSAEPWLDVPGVGRLLLNVVMIRGSSIL